MIFSSLLFWLCSTVQNGCDSSKQLQLLVTIHKNKARKHYLNQKQNLGTYFYRLKVLTLAVVFVVVLEVAVVVAGIVAAGIDPLNASVNRLQSYLTEFWVVQ